MERVSRALIAYGPLTTDDAEAAAALIRAAFADQGAATDPPSSALNETAEIVAQKLAEGGGIAARRGGRLVGTALFQSQGEALYIGRLAVAPGERGQGIAGRIVAEIEAEARRRGFARTRLNVRLDLPDNLRLFERTGYVEVERKSHPGYARPTFAVMEKALG